MLREGERDLYVKQTYSVHRNDVPPEDTISGSGSGSKDDVKSQDGKKEKKKPRKWHLSEWLLCSGVGDIMALLNRELEFRALAFGVFNFCLSCLPIPNFGRDMFFFNFASPHTSRSPARIFLCGVGRNT